MTEPRPSFVPSRREFLAATTATLAARGTARASADAIRVGLIGVGGRCSALAKALKALPGAKIVAVADVYGPNLDYGKSIAEPGAFATGDYRALLARGDVDAVIVATPDHLHVPIAVAACEAGKDVYVEKPLTHDLAEGRAIVAAQDKHKRVVQVGMQQRSMPHVLRGLELVRGGRLGAIRKVHLTWNRNVDRLKSGPQGVDFAVLDWKGFLGGAPDQPADGYKFRNWRWFWDFGGGIFTDLMVHFVDVVQWYLGADHPETALSVGSMFQYAGAWDTPDTVQTLLTYPGGVQVHFEGTFSNAREGAHVVFMGTDASLYLDRGRLELVPERGKGQPESLILGKGPKGADFYDQPDADALHLGNWLDAIRSRSTPNAPAQAGVSSASAAHLANRALRTGGLARWEG